MDQNVGRMDAGVRWVMAVVLFALSIIINAQPLLSFLAALGALVMVATALTGKCPFYTLLGLNTCPPHPRTRAEPPVPTAGLKGRLP